MYLGGWVFDAFVATFHPFIFAQTLLFVEEHQHGHGQRTVLQWCNVSTLRVVVYGCRLVIVDRRCALNVNNK